MANTLQHLMIAWSFEDKTKELYTKLLKLQIDNYLSYGLSTASLNIISNVLLNYRGVNTIPLSADNAQVITGYDTFRQKLPEKKLRKRCWIKILGAALAFEEKLLSSTDQYWLHDIDCYQNAPIPNITSLLDSSTDIAFASTYDSRRVSDASLFFHNHGKSVFRTIINAQQRRPYQSTENALRELIYGNKLEQRIKLLDYSYQFTGRRLDRNRYAYQTYYAIHGFPFSSRFQAILSLRDINQQLLVNAYLRGLFQQHFGVPT